MIIGLSLVVFVAQIASGIVQSPLHRLRAKVPVDRVADVAPQQLAGKYSHPAKDLHVVGLSGDDLYLFPDGTYIFCEWADVEPVSVRDKGSWKFRDGLITLVSDSDVTWDAGAEREYVVVHRRSHAREILLVGTARDLSYFEKNARDDPETELLVLAKERSRTFNPAQAARTKSQLMRESWKPQYFHPTSH